MANQRQTRGKQKIEMKMIQKEEDRITTFSKRRSGIYKKANELATLCGAEITFGTYSPRGKAYLFAQPSMGFVENRLIDMEYPLPSFNLNTPLVRAHQQAKLEGLNHHYNELASSLDAEKEKRKAIKKLLEKSAVKNASGKGWWETPVDVLEYEELFQMKESLEELQKKLCNHINEETRATNNNSNASSGKNLN